MRSKLGLVIAILGLILALRTSLTIWRIWKSGDQLTQAQQELVVAQKAQIDLQKRLSYVQSPEFVEKEAREKLNMGRPGEVVVILPKSDNAQGQVLSTQDDRPNWRKWYDLYIGL